MSAPPDQVAPVPPCPVCASHATVSGKLRAGDNDGHFSGSFYPAGAASQFVPSSVGFEANAFFSACSACGFAWSYLDPAKLARLMDQRGRGPSPFYVRLEKILNIIGVVLATGTWLLIGGLCLFIAAYYLDWLP